MEIIELRMGEPPAADVDCIRVYSRGADFDLMGTALCEGDSVSFVPDRAFASRAEAVAAGVAWADMVDVATLYIATDPTPGEADGPLQA